MPTTADHVPVDTLEEGQILSPHQQTKPSPQIPLHERISNIAAPTSGMDTQTTNNVAAATHALVQPLPPPQLQLQLQQQQQQQQQQPGIPSSSADFQTDRLGMHAVNTATYPANISLYGNDRTIGESTQSTLPATEGPTTTATATTENPTRNVSAAPYPLPDEAEKSAGGYERKIGRGTSWRRDHNTLNEQDYTVRGRGRGRAGGHPPHHHSSARGRGRRDENYDSREYNNNNSYRRDPYDRRPPPPTPPPPPPSHAHVGSAFPPSPDPYYESPRAGAYPSPAYDTRRDYPPPSYHPSDAPPPPPARYYDDYRRGGYDARDIPPPPLPPNSSHLPTPPTVDSRRPYDRSGVPGRDDPADYGRGYPPRSRDPRDDYPPPIPRDVHPRLPPSDRLPPRDAGRYMDEGRRTPPRRLDDPRRSRDSMEYRDESSGRRASISERPYARMAGEPIKPGDSPPNSKLPVADPSISPREGKHKDIMDSSTRETLGGGGGPRARGPPPPPALGEKHVEPSTGYGYDRERPPLPPAERYRDAPGDYGRAPYPPSYAGHPRDVDHRSIRGESPYERSRDPRDTYYDYPPPSDYREREPYPPRAPPPLDYPSRNAPYDERYPPPHPPRGATMDLDTQRGREGYRDLPPRSQDSRPKRKYSASEYMDPYDDPRAPRYLDRPDYPRPPYDYDDRDLKRTRPIEGGRYPSDPYNRPTYDDRGPPREDFSRPPAATSGPPREYRKPDRPRPQGRFFLVKTSTAENLVQSRATGFWGVQVKDVEILREAFKNGRVYLIFALDESGRFSGYATMESDVGAIQPMTWMKEHCDPVGAAFQVIHHSTDDVRTNATTKSRNMLTEGKPIRFGQDGQEISPREGAGLVEELERMSGPENVEKRANATVTRGSGRRARGGGPGGRGGFGSQRGGRYDGPRGRGRGRG